MGAVVGVPQSRCTHAKIVRGAGSLCTGHQRPCALCVYGIVLMMEGIDGNSDRQGGEE